MFPSSFHGRRSRKPPILHSVFYTPDAPILESPIAMVGGAVHKFFSKFALLNCLEKMNDSVYHICSSTGRQSAWLIVCIYSLSQL